VHLKAMRSALRRSTSRPGQQEQLCADQRRRPYRLRAVKLRASFLVVAVPAVVLVSGCGGDTKASGSPATHTTPAATTAAPSAAHATPTLPGAAHRDEVLALLRKTLTTTHLGPTNPSDQIQDCGIDIARIYPQTGAYPHTRETITAMLRAAGWKTATTGGSDESHLTTDTWDVFLTREKDVTDDQGRKFQTLQISASCLPLPTPS